ncbi:hypothetical protein VB636_05830, partial [Paracoccus sp. APAP_BH8]
QHYHQPFGSYSSGMRSRLAMGTSMGIHFDTYLVDEVTSVGDANFRAIASVKSDRSVATISPAPASRADRIDNRPMGRAGSSTFSSAESPGNRWKSCMTRPILAPRQRSPAVRGGRRPAGR